MLIWFLPVFLVLLMIGLPVVFGLLLAPGALLVLDGSARDLPVLYRNLYNGIDSFPLMALPFFMLAGEIMNRGGITTRLVEFSQAFMGHLRGGLAHVNILSSILFAGLSGSAVADTSALGSTLIPAMEKNGYSRKFAAAITAASSVIGPIIPPSGIMIIYAYVMGESVAALFLAGIVRASWLAWGSWLWFASWLTAMTCPKPSVSSKKARPSPRVKPMWRGGLSGSTSQAFYMVCRGCLRPVIRSMDGSCLPCCSWLRMASVPISNLKSVPIFALCAKRPWPHSKLRSSSWAAFWQAL
jgi:TRAP-type mannitol/chloroaromatic compound transport system permease large subunit